MPAVDDFKVVSRRRRRSQPVKGVHRLKTEEREEERKQIESDIDVELVIRRVQEAVEEIKDSSYRNILINKLEDGLKLIGVSSLPEIICYGLGNFSQTKAARYQLAAIVTIKSHFRSKVELYDPLFFNAELSILKNLDLVPLESNEEAKRTVGEQTSLIYMPHCPHQLTNNLIYANWSRDRLANCVILSNSFRDLVDALSLKDLNKSTNYLARIQPYTTEIELDNVFPHKEVFNGSAIHIFSREKLERVPIDCWQDREEPVYKDNCEFIRQSQL